MVFTFPAKAMKNLHNKINKEELKQKLLQDTRKRITLSFYCYAKILNVAFFRDHLYILFSEAEVLGRIYVAKEGINGQISVPENQFDFFKKQMDTVDFLKNIRLNVAIEDDGLSFFVLKIKIRNKIVADGLNDDSFDSSDNGIHLSAEAFNQLTEQDDTIIVDMRNHYEHEVGHFKNAIRPDVNTFKEALPVVEDLLKDDKEKPIIMYCTGGIRCEKASAYYKHKGFKNVYQVEGGIIEYARQVKKLGLENKYIGKNFVFDDRLGERITEDVISKCHQCGEANDNHHNCANDACHILFIQCKSCAIKYDLCCSTKCKEYNALSDDDKFTSKHKLEFNGTKFGKGRYKAAKNSGVDLS